MARYGHNDCSQSLYGQSIAGQEAVSMVTVVMTRSRMDKPRQPDECAGDASQHQMLQEDALKPLPFQLPLPGKNASDQDRNRRKCRHEQVAVRGRGQALPLCPVRKKVEGHARKEQRNRKVDQDHVLRMFCEKHRLEVERVQGLAPLTAR